MRKMSKKTEHKVFEFVKKQFVSVIDDIIYTNDNGDTVLWNQYIVRRQEHKSIVIRKSDDSVHVFNKVKIALPWCVFDRLNKFAEANKLKDLDMLIESTVQHQMLHTKLLNKGSRDFRIIQAAKLYEAKYKYIELSTMLDKYISQANYWQSRGFKHGTIRITN